MYGSFYGWYLKNQSDTQTLAVIPAIHQAGGRRTCSIQIITDKKAWTVQLPGNAFRRVGNSIIIGESYFGKKGICMSVQTPEITVRGKIKFGALAPLRYDIMGPFAGIPFLECRHSVYSMCHSVSGTVYVNKQKFIFKNACGYWEGDRGRSFPKEYLWTQCSFTGGALMLSVADIPFAGFHFTGIIGFVLWQGKEYRLATYLGAKVSLLRHGKVRIRQGDMELEAHLLEADGQALRAPAKGDMVRTIHESATCKAFYRFRKKNCTIFEFKTKQASFEYEYP